MTAAELRFLRAIAERVPPDRVAEVHLFPAMRQGPMETGVAVVAVAEEGGRPDAVAVFTARYRLAVKGLERGTWVVEVTADADAPLVTVTAVVRGVQRRTGEAVDPALLSGDDFRAAIAEPEPAAPR